jgi:hypothetical protein
MTFRVIDGGKNRTSPPHIAPSASPMTELGDFLRTHVRRAERDARTIECTKLGAGRHLGWNT